MDKIKPKELLKNQLKDFGLITGVPCSYFKGMINASINSGRYVSAVDEGAAVAIATGYQIASGKKALVLMQNSGIGNAISPLTSLNYVFREPITLMVSQRGGENDEPQHELMGNIDTTLLNTCSVKTKPISDIIDKPIEFDSDKESVAYMVPKGTFEMVDIEEQNRNYDSFQQRQVWEPIKSELLQRQEVINNIYKTVESLSHSLIYKYVFIATTGYTGRELWAMHDSEHNLYMVGSMGCALPLAIGMAFGDPNLHVYVIDGDGAMLMRTGSMATAGYRKPKNLIHILLDNQAYATTGKQSTDSKYVDWTNIAKGFGYEYIADINSISSIKDILTTQALYDLLTFIHIPIQSGNADVGRPDKKPWEVKERLINYIRNKYKIV